MKQSSFSLPMRKTMFVALFAFMAIGACKSKKPVVEPVVQQPKEEVAKPEPAPTPVPTRSAEEIATERIEGLFNSIAGSVGSDAANQNIQAALSMFSNQDIPVLIVIHEEKGLKDYDEPTTIKRYLEYLKDTKKNLNMVTNVRMDANNKVTELELKRK